MRMTKKYDGEEELYANFYEKPDYESSFDREERCVDRLGEFEDIEEEFGINLVKLLTAKKVYYTTWNRDCSGFIIQETEKLFINLTDRTIECYEDEYDEFTYDLEIQKYGKKNTLGGWAFTKEELL